VHYLLSVIYDEAQEPLPPGELEAQYARTDRVTDEMRAAGAWVFAGGLRPLDSATVVRVAGGRTTVTDGPFAETKEQLGGFYLIEARDLNDAIQVAAKIPSARIGSVEVRPVVDFGQQ